MFMMRNKENNFLALLSGGLSDFLPTCICKLCWVQDPLQVATEKIKVPLGISNYHFENVQDFWFSS